MAGEVKQLRSLLAQQAAPQLCSTIQLLDGPIAAADSAAAGPRSPHAAGKGSSKSPVSPGADTAHALPALAAAAAAAGRAAAGGGAAAGRASEGEDVEGCSDTGLPAGR